MAKTIIFHKGLSEVAAPEYLTFEKSEEQQSCRQAMNETIKRLVPEYGQQIVDMIDQFVALAAGEAYSQGWIDCNEDMKKQLAKLNIDN